MLPVPIIPTLTFASTAQTLFHKVLIAFLNGFHHICGTFVKLYDQPLGGTFPGFDNGGNIHFAVANRDHWLTSHGGAILDVEQRRPLAKRPDYLSGIGA